MLRTTAGTLCYLQPTKETSTVTIPICILTNSALGLTVFYLKNRYSVILSVWKESYDQPRQHIRKQRHYFANKGPYSQGYGFSSSHVCREGWTIKKAEHRRIDGFELWCWRRLLRVPWTARRSNQSILKEISPGCSLEGLMLKLKLQYFGYLMRRTDSFEKTLMLERLRARGEGDGRGWHGLMASLTQWT